MTTQLDITYQDRRLNMSRKVEDLAVLAWLDRDWSDRTTYIDKVVPIVEGGMMATVALVNAYMNAKMRVADADPEMPDRVVNPDSYGIQDLRGLFAAEVYERPFGALGAKIEQGMEFKEADKLAAEYVRKLVRTDLQLAYTKASTTWMALYG